LGHNSLLLQRELETTPLSPLLLLPHPLQVELGSSSSFSVVVAICSCATSIS
jgi:hypothetical protein